MNDSIILSDSILDKFSKSSLEKIVGELIKNGALDTNSVIDINFISKKTFSKGVGTILQKDKPTYYFKGYKRDKTKQNDNQELDMLRELSLYNYIWDNGFLISNFVPEPVVSSPIRYDDVDFILTTDSIENESTEKMLRLRQVVFDLIKHKKIPEDIFESGELLRKRLFTLALFHAELTPIIMEEKNIAKGYIEGRNKSVFCYFRDNLRDVKQFKSIEELSAQLIECDIDLNKYLTIYETLVREHESKTPNVFAHNDTKEDNWVEDKMIDFGRCGYGTDSGDVEKLLFSIPFKHRNHFRHMYYDERVVLESLLYAGRDKIVEESRPEFVKHCIHRGFIDSLRLMGWHRACNDKIRYNKMKENVEFYQTQLNLDEYS